MYILSAAPFGVPILCGGLILILIISFLPCFRKVSRQEYLKKREQKKLEELRYDGCTFCSYLSSAARCSFCFLMTFDLKKRIMDWLVLFPNNFFYLASPQRRYRRWAISIWWCEAYWSRISWVKVICLLLLVYSYIIRFPSQYYESMSTHFALNYLSFKYYVKLIFVICDWLVYIIFQRVYVCWMLNPCDVIVLCVIKAFLFCALLDWSAASLSPPCFSLLRLFDHSFLNCLYFFHSTANVLGLLFSNKFFWYLLKKKKSLHD